MIRKYEVTDLAPAPGTYDDFEARGLNNLGQVVGVIRVAGRSRAFAWSSRIGIKQLPDHGANAGATSVNDNGVIAGWASSTAPSTCRACLWKQNTIIDLSAPAGSYSIAHDINASEVVVGELSGHACCSALGSLVDLGTMGGPTSAAAAINAAGQIVGWSEIDGNGTRRGFLCNGPGQPMQDLGHLGGGWSVACDINDAGQIVGYSPDSHFCVRACLWQDGSITDLGTLGGTFSNAIAINNNGAIAGMAAFVVTDRATHAFVYGWPGIPAAPGTSVMMDVNARLRHPAGQPVFDGIRAINDEGELLASDNMPVRYLLTPVSVTP